MFRTVWMVLYAPLYLVIITLPPPLEHSICHPICKRIHYKLATLKFQAGHYCRPPWMIDINSLISNICIIYCTPPINITYQSLLYAPLWTVAPLHLFLRPNERTIPHHLVSLQFYIYCTAINNHQFFLWIYVLRSICTNTDTLYALFLVFQTLVMRICGVKASLTARTGISGRIRWL